jgi:hypothetical protein
VTPLPADGWSQADADGKVFGYLGIKISEGAVWTTGRGARSRYLGPLAGACAGIDEPRRSWIGSFISSVLVGDGPAKGAKLYVAFTDGSRYERLPLPWVSDLDWPKIGGEIGRFNEAAYLATRQ